MPTRLYSGNLGAAVSMLLYKPDGHPCDATAVPRHPLPTEIWACGMSPLSASTPFELLCLL